MKIQQQIEDNITLSCERKIKMKKPLVPTEQVLTKLVVLPALPSMMAIASDVLPHASCPLFASSIPSLIVTAQLLPHLGYTSFMVAGYLLPHSSCIPLMMAGHLLPHSGYTPFMVAGHLLPHSGCTPFMVAGHLLPHSGYTPLSPP